MAVSVEVKTGNRRILEYVFSPLVETSLGRHEGAVSGAPAPLTFTAPRRRSIAEHFDNPPGGESLPGSPFRSGPNPGGCGARPPWQLARFGRRRGREAVGRARRPPRRSGVLPPAWRRSAGFGRVQEFALTRHRGRVRGDIRRRTAPIFARAPQGAQRGCRADSGGLSGAARRGAAVWRPTRAAEPAGGTQVKRRLIQFEANKYHGESSLETTRIGPHRPWTAPAIAAKRDRRPRRESAQSPCAASLGGGGVPRATFGAPTRRVAIRFQRSVQPFDYVHIFGRERALAGRRVASRFRRVFGARAVEAGDFARRPFKRINRPVIKTLTRSLKPHLRRVATPARPSFFVTFMQHGPRKAVFGGFRANVGL